MPSDPAGRAAEHAARNSYGKLVAILAGRTRDFSSAEDALASALLRALEDWPRSGVPRNPEAWLIAAARRIEVDRWRHAALAERLAGHIELLEQERAERGDRGLPDERLKLLFVCAHPAIDPRMRTPLMLQMVLGLDARRIASAFLVTPSSIGQRLARAKAKIRDGGIRFEVPPAGLLAERTGSVLDAIYTAFTLGWDNAFTGDETTYGLADEAIWLARLTIDLLPAHGEALGLLALMLFSEARRPARRDPRSGAFVALAAQDCRLWLEPLIGEAEHLLRRAGTLRELGRYQIEAAIQAVHAARRKTGRTDWMAIVQLYRGLVALMPAIGAKVALAAAIGEADGPEPALAYLQAIAENTVAAYQPYWVVRAHLLARAHDREGAVLAYERAIGLTEDDAVRRHLGQKMREAMMD